MDKDIINKDILGLVLAGGFSRRMGQDKALLSYSNRSQLSVCVEFLNNYCPEVFVSVRGDQVDQPGYRDYPQILDRTEPKIQGPLAGILSAFALFPDRTWLVLACDLPFLDRHTLDYLIAHRDRKKMATAFRNAGAGFPEPLCTIYEPRARAVLEKFFAGGTTCPRRILSQADPRLLDLPNPMALNNVNTLAEYTTHCGVKRSKLPE